MDLYILVPLFVCSLFLAWIDVISKPDSLQESIVHVVIRFVYVVIWVWVGMEVYFLMVRMRV